MFDIKLVVSHGGKQQRRSRTFIDVRPLSTHDYSYSFCILELLYELLSNVIVRVIAGFGVAAFLLVGPYTSFSYFTQSSECVGTYSLSFCPRYRFASLC